MNKIIATDSLKGVTGSIVYWTLRGSISVQSLQDAWAMEGLGADMLPDAPSVAQAMYRAVQSIATDALLVKSAPMVTAGYNLLVKSNNNGRPSYDTKWLAIAPKNPLDNPTIIDIVTMGIPMDAAGMDVAAKITLAYHTARTHFASHDIGAWLVSMAKSLHATPLRPSGGMYFIPANRESVWQTWSNAAELCSAATMFGIPAMPTNGVVKAVIDAISTETADFVADIDSKMDKVGVRALDARKRDIESFAKKIEAYSEIIGSATADLNEKLEALKLRVDTQRLSAFADL